MITVCFLGKELYCTSAIDTIATNCVDASIVINHNTIPLKWKVIEILVVHVHVMG